MFYLAASPATHQHPSVQPSFTSFHGCEVFLCTYAPHICFASTALQSSEQHSVGPSFITYHSSLTQNFPALLWKPCSLPMLQPRPSSFLSRISGVDPQLLSLSPSWHPFKPPVTTPKEKSVESIHHSLPLLESLQYRPCTPVKARLSLLQHMVLCTPTLTRQHTLTLIIASPKHHSCQTL